MINPHELPAPADAVAQVHAFARDLAYGVLHKQIHPDIEIGKPPVKQLLEQKWTNGHPDLEVLLSFGYLVSVPTVNPNFPSLRLTERAFRLLERPAELPTTFIAYGTQESSAFGLAIEYRLRSLDIPVFIDRSIPIGEEWDDHLVEKIQQSKNFICLLAPTTLKRSDYICKEIEIAKEANCRFISVHHSQFNPETHFYERPADLKQFVMGKQRIKVDEESAKAYHDAVEELVNTLGILLPTKM